MQCEAREQLGKRGCMYGEEEEEEAWAQGALLVVSPSCGCLWEHRFGQGNPDTPNQRQLQKKSESELPA